VLNTFPPRNQPPDPNSLKGFFSPFPFPKIKVESSKIKGSKPINWLIPENREHNITENNEESKNGGDESVLKAFDNDWEVTYNNKSWPLLEKLDHATIGKIKMVIGECEEKRVGVKVNNEARMEKRGKKEKLATTFLEPKSLNVDLFTTSIVSH